MAASTSWKRLEFCLVRLHYPARFAVVLIVDHRPLLMHVVFTSLASRTTIVCPLSPLSRVLADYFDKLRSISPFINARQLSAIFVNRSTIDHPLWQRLSRVSSSVGKDARRATDCSKWDRLFIPRWVGHFRFGEPAPLRASLNSPPSTGQEIGQINVPSATWQLEDFKCVSALTYYRVWVVPSL